MKSQTTKCLCIIKWDKIVIRKIQLWVNFWSVKIKGFEWINQMVLVTSHCGCSIYTKLFSRKGFINSRFFLGSEFVRFSSSQTRANPNSITWQFSVVNLESISLSLFLIDGSLIDMSFNQNINFCLIPMIISSSPFWIFFFMLTTATILTLYN